MHVTCFYVLYTNTVIYALYAYMHYMHICIISTVVDPDDF
jgi:hypothetical protein